MQFLVLGKGKTGSLVAEVARERGHAVRALDVNENSHASALTAESLAGVDAVIDFTAPEAALENIRAVLALGGRIVVGTTGWYAHLDELKSLAQKRGGGSQQVPLNDDLPWINIGSAELLDLNRALDELNTLDAGKAQMVEVRYFLGCTAEETASVMGVSKATVDRELKFAKSWLYSRIHPEVAKKRLNP